LDSQQLKAGRYSGAIVLADISGYTAFLDNVRVAHQDDEFADGQISMLLPNPSTECNR